MSKKTITVKLDDVIAFAREMGQWRKAVDNPAINEAEDAFEPYLIAQIAMGIATGIFVTEGTEIRPIMDKLQMVFQMGYRAGLENWRPAK